MENKFNFTKSAIDNLNPPATGRKYVYDTKVPGLCLCATAAGGKTFYSYRKVGGQPERIMLGKFPAMTVEAARDEAARVSGKVVDGVNPNDKRRMERQAPTLGELFAEFIDLPTRTREKRAKSEKTKHDYRQIFEKHLSPWRGRKVTAIARTAIERLHNEVGESSGYYTANRVLQLLKVMLNTAIDRGYLKENAAARLTLFEEQERERYLEADELPKFWQALEAEPSDTVREFLKVALFTGQRRGNVAAMRWADVNINAAIWSIPRTATKNRKPHIVPLSGVALEILNRRAASKGTGEYVFPGRHGTGHLKDPMLQWRRIVKNAGIENLRIHDLRRSMGTWQTSTGANTQIVGKTLGHLDAASTAIYARAAMEPVRAAIETATAAMMLAANPAKPKPNRKPTKGAKHAK